MVCIDENGEEEGGYLTKMSLSRLDCIYKRQGFKLSKMEMSLIRTQARMRTQVGMIGQVNYSVQVCRQ